MIREITLKLAPKPLLQAGVSPEKIRLNDSELFYPSKNYCRAAILWQVGFAVVATLAGTDQARHNWQKRTGGYAGH